MNTAVSNFKPGVLGGALRKGLQSPDLERANSTTLDGPSRAAIVLMALGPDVAGNLLKNFTAAEAQKVSSLMANFRSIDREVMIQVLEGENAILKNRDLMGATDPKKADKGTIRADFADSIDANAVHGSDGPDTAAHEITFFFAGMNVFGH
jgi:hypothetical protein